MRPARSDGNCDGRNRLTPQAIAITACAPINRQTTPVAVKRLYPLPNGGIAASQGHAGREAKALELLVSFGKEASIMQQLRHPNIVMLMGVSATRAGDLVMVTELMDRGERSAVPACPAPPAPRVRRVRASTAPPHATEGLRWHDARPS